MEKAHHPGQAPTRRLLLRLLLLLVGGVLLVLLSSRPAGVAERQRSGLLDPGCWGGGTAQRPPKNARTVPIIRSCCSSVSSGYSGSDRHSAAHASVAGRSPRA